MPRSAKWPPVSIHLPSALVVPARIRSVSVTRTPASAALVLAQVQADWAQPMAVVGLVKTPGYADEMTVSGDGQCLDVYTSNITSGQKTRYRDFECTITLRSAGNFTPGHANDIGKIGRGETDDRPLQRTRLSVSSMAIWVALTVPPVRLISICRRVTSLSNELSLKQTAL